MVRHAVEFGVRNRHPSVMRLRQHRPGHWIDRPVSGDDADRIIDRRKQRIRPQHPAVCRAAVRPVRRRRGRLRNSSGGRRFRCRCSACRASPRGRGVLADSWRCRRAPASPPMEWQTKWTEPSMPIGKALDGGMNVLRQRFQRLAAARIVQIERGEAGAFQRRLHLSKRSRRPADAVQQDDAVLRRVGRCGPAAHLYSRSCHHGK